MAARSGGALQNQEGNFTRALRSLERRGLIERKQQPGCHAGYRITAAGVREARRLGAPLAEIWAPELASA